jgi:dihydroorotase
MEGKELSEITLVKDHQNKPPFIRLLSEDGKDVASDELFLAAMKEARRIGIPVSCHCDLGGENDATKRAIELGKKAACYIHLAHVSTKEAAAMIREAKKNQAHLSCEVTPHHIALTEKDATAMGAGSFGRVNPPLRSEEDRRALIEAIIDGTIDAIATDHAPHTYADKELGAPGFTGLETAFAVCYSTLVAPGHISLSKLSSLMSAAPARILGLNQGAGGRGLIAPGLRADFAIADIGAVWKINPALFKSRGKNSPFTGRELRGKIQMTIHSGQIVYR